MNKQRRKTNDERRKTLGRASFVLRPSSLVVIGYGNELRGDDAIGQQVARAVAAWDLPAVRALAVHQLTPELAEDLAHAHDAIFIDAYRADAIEASVYLRPIAPSDFPDFMGHVGEPHALLALTNAIYRHVPHAWWITVPATSFAYGADLSDGAKAGISHALRLIHALVTSLRGVPCTKSD